MPTYDYHCDACGEHHEIFHSMSEDARRKCPACGKLKLVRRIGTGGGVIFKGSGFYSTDYRSSSYETGKAQDQGGGPGSCAGPDPSGACGGGGCAAPE